MLSGTYEFDASTSLEIQIAHSGDLASAPESDCTALLGRPLVSGLPSEFAEAALDGLVRFAPDTNRSGRLVIDGGGYDAADSSQFAFEHAAALLKWAILATPTAEVTVTSLTQFLHEIQRR
jgi:hypothetical protein